VKKLDDDRHDWIPYLLPNPEDLTQFRLPPQLTIADRIRATIRHPEYWKDVKVFRSKLKKGSLETQKTNPHRWERDSRVANRWNLPATIIDKAHAEYLLSYYADRPWRSSEPIRIMDLQPRFVLLSIDLSETSQRLNTIFKAMVRTYQKEFGLDESRRNRPFKCDPFVIYDLVNEEGLSISKAAQKVFNVKFPCGQGPSYSAKSKRLYAQANRAYEWAVDQIKRVGDESTV